MKGLRPVDEAILDLLDRVKVSQEKELKPLNTALGLYAAENILSPVNVPPADNSAMDGYAVQLASIRANDWLKISDRVPAGSVGISMEPGTAARIFTGAPIPEGADTVVMQENCEFEQGRVRILAMPEMGANVRECGQDLLMGSTVVRRGERLTPQLLALLASVGCVEVAVCKPLRIAILSTGDELVEPGGELAPGQIFNSNRFALDGLIRGLGMESVDLGIIEDNPKATEQALRQAVKRADLIVSTGGVSVGEEDHVKSAVEHLGEIDLWKLAIKPGKPMAFGHVLGKPFFGLPGNPVSTFVTFLIVARPYLLAMQGAAEFRSESIMIPAAFSFSGGSRREYLRVRIIETEAGEPCLERFANQGSGIMTSVAWADGLAEIDIGQEVSAGDRLRFYKI